MKRLFAICLAALTPALGLAGIVPVAGSVSGSGPYVWSYDLQLSADAGAHGRARALDEAPPAADESGGFLTLFGFAGYVAGSCAAPDTWVCTVQSAVDASANGLAAGDADVVNLTWAYVGGPVLGGLPSGRSLGSFSAQSSHDTAGALRFASRAVTNRSGHAGSVSDGEGQTEGPVAGAIASATDTGAVVEALAVNEVAEPGALALAGLGLAALGYAHRGPRRRRTA